MDVSPKRETCTRMRLGSTDSAQTQFHWVVKHDLAGASTFLFVTFFYPTLLYLLSFSLYSVLLCATLFTVYACLLFSYVVWLLYSCLDRYSTRLSFLLCPRVCYFTLSFPTLLHSTLLFASLPSLSLLLLLSTLLVSSGLF